MSTRAKRTVLAAVVVSALMFVATACGGSSNTSENGSSSESTAVTTSASGGSGSVTSQCADLEKWADDLSSSMDQLNADDPTDLDSMVSQLETFTSKVPSDIKGDWKVIVDAFKDYAKALDGVDMANMTDPATITGMTEAAKSFESSQFLTASDNLEAWSTKNCGGASN